MGLQKNKDMDPSIIKWKCFTPIYKTVYNLTMCRMSKVKYIKNFIQGTMREFESSFIYQSTRRKNNIIQNKGGKVQLNLSIYSITFFENTQESCVLFH